ncbi:nucleotidyltransferase domain-containing protein [Candidatus Curtissbacteria bacterium]|nr:nucleotidyltransferase domain-containing protein [Candidatus Curtissbacteria bacterium]
MVTDQPSKYPAVSLAYFYGSQVGGAVHAESDLDLALVTSDAHDIDYGEIYSHLLRIITGYNLDLRLITVNDPSVLFLFRVIRDNQCIYKRSEKERVEFETTVLRKLYDSLYIRSIYHKYLEKHIKGGTYAR